MTPVRHVLAAALVAAGATRLGAQAKCDLREDQPNELKSVRLTVLQADAAHDASGVAAMVSALKSLHDNAPKIDPKNAVGRQWIEGRLYYNLARVLPAGTVVTRGQVGLDNAAANLDAIRAAADAFAAVDRAAPACGEQTNAYKQNLFALAYGAAVRAYGADDLTASRSYLDLARSFNEKSPDLYNVYAALAQKQNDNKAMLDAYKKVIEYAGTDTAYRDVRETATQNIGILTLQEAEKAAPADKRAMLTEARDLFVKQLGANKCDLIAFTGLSRANMALSDTAAVKAGYAQLAQNTACDYTDLQLFDAGANAAILNQNDVSRQLLVRGLQKNPFYRDALFNLANVYWTMEQPDSLQAVASRLVQVDPDNPDNWRMLAAAQQMRLKTLKDPAAKKALTDSLVKSAEAFTRMPVKVTFTEWRNSGKDVVLSGVIENRQPDAEPARPARPGQKAAPAPARPACATANASYAITFEFLDATGNVVGTQSANVGPVACGQTGTFSVKQTGSNIAAFRYKSVR